MKQKFQNVGDARKAAQKNADRDSCEWKIVKDYFASIPYYIVDEFTGIYSSEKVVEHVKPGSQTDTRHTLTVNDEELELIKAILKDKFDPARVFYPGDEKTKVSLFEKVCKCLSFS